MDPNCRPARRLLDYTVRPISPDDASALNDFHERCSERTHRLRFFSSQAHLPPAMLSFFTNVDHNEREALVAVLDARIIAVGRYDRVTEDLTEESTAEVAFVVADEFQGNGIASDLLGRLADLARSRSISRFVAETLAENMAMQTVFRKSPYKAFFKRVVGDPSVIRVTMTL